MRRFEGRGRSIGAMTDQLWEKMGVRTNGITNACKYSSIRGESMHYAVDGTVNLPNQTN